MLRRPALLLALCALAPIACGPAARPPITEPDPLAVMEDDTEMACGRTRSAGAWTQLVYRSALWGRLAVAADNRDPAAWNEIAELMEWNRHSTPQSQCTPQIVERVRESAARLGAGP